MAVSHRQILKGFLTRFLQVGFMAKHVGFISPGGITVQRTLTRYVPLDFCCGSVLFSLFFLSFLESLWSRCKHVNVSRNLLKNVLCESTFLTLGRLYLICTTFWLVPTHSVVIQIVTATLENYEASSVEIEALDIGNGRPSDCGWRRWSNRRETLNKMHRHQSFAKSEILYWKG